MKGKGVVLFFCLIRRKRNRSTVLQIRKTFFFSDQGKAEALPPLRIANRGENLSSWGMNKVEGKGAGLYSTISRREKKTTYEY